MGIFASGRSKFAYQGELTCPFVINGVDCKSRAIRYIEHVGPLRIRYRCRKCGHTFQYDISARYDVNPYAAYGERSKFGRYLKQVLGGRKLKGGFK